MGDIYPKIRLAAVQASPIYLNREATVKKACDLIREAGANGADIVGFPESFIPGHPVFYIYEMSPVGARAMKMATELYKNCVEISSEDVDLLCKAAADAGVNVVMGITEKKPNQTGTTYNTQLFISSTGKIIGKHQKLHPTLTEQLVHTRGCGSTLGTVQTEFGPISGLICGENSNPLAMGVLASEYTRVHVASWPNHFMLDHWSPMRQSIEIASKNAAYVCKAFVIASAGTVNEEMIEMIAITEEDKEFLRDPSKTGGSMIIDPAGNIIAGPMPGGQEGILYADVNLEDCITNHLVHDFGGYYNRPDVLRLFLNDEEEQLVHRASGKKDSTWWKPEQEMKSIKTPDVRNTVPSFSKEAE